MSSTGHPTEEGILMKSCFFSYRIQEASCLKALILLGGFNHPDTYWKSNTANCKQSRRLLECIEDSFLAEVIENPSKGFATGEQQVQQCQKTYQRDQDWRYPGLW